MQRGLSAIAEVVVHITSSTQGQTVVVCVYMTHRAAAWRSHTFNPSCHASCTRLTHRLTVQKSRADERRRLHKRDVPGALVPGSILPDQSVSLREWSRIRISIGRL